MRQLAALVLVLAVAHAQPLLAAVVPGAPFSDHAVLQRDRPLPVWGTADPGEAISVSFAGHTASTVADGAGAWRVELPALPASATPGDLVIAGGTATITLTNIVVGEVWLAAGQSNMEWSVGSSRDAAFEIAASARFPLIRHISKPSTTDRRPWSVAGPTTTGGFSGVAWFFARDLHEMLGVPVGIINCAWGGTPVEAWVPPAAYETVPSEAAKVQARWATVLEAYPQAKARYDAEVAQVEREKAAAEAAHRPYTRRWIAPPEGPGHQNAPSELFTRLIAPLAPGALRGVIWYQGESNGGRPEEYHALFAAMITGWRQEFTQGDLPFYWAQLANFGDPYGINWALLREAQTRALALPATGQAVTIDVGDARDIHPVDKASVGRRLARLALARTHAMPVIDSGPLFAGANLEAAGLRVSFTAIHGGLRTPSTILGGFEVAGADRVFKRAEAMIEGDTVLVRSPLVPEPIAVRYAWRDAPNAGLYNGEGLPAPPFRSDDW